MELNIFHMYPDLLNLYGDIGNITCLKKRCEWRGIKINMVDFSLSNEADIEWMQTYFSWAVDQTGVRTLFILIF